MEKKKKRNRRRFFINFILFLLLAGFLTGWTVLIHKFGADGLVNKIGIRNGYLIVFAAGASGGLSGFTAPGFMAVLTTFAAGGSNPFLLGIIGGTALFLGDSLFFYLGVKGRSLLASLLEDKIKQFSEFIKNKSLWSMRFFIFLYFSFAPLPNDLITIPLGLAHFEYKKFIAPALLGNINFVLWISLLFV
jgi:membrane protein YqaA with SNARE-associated domain